MVKAFLISLAAVALLPISGCDKETSSKEDCFPNAATTRKIVDKPASIQAAGGTYFIVEQGTIDTRLLPCNLPAEFKADTMRVVVSGDVKEPVQTPAAPCCIENFVITKISK